MTARVVATIYLLQRTEIPESKAINRVTGILLLSQHFRSIELNKMSLFQKLLPSQYHF